MKRLIGGLTLMISLSAIADNVGVKNLESPGISNSKPITNTITYAIQDGFKPGDRFNKNINPTVTELKIFSYTTQEQVLKGQPMKLYSTMESAAIDGVGVYQEHKTPYPVGSANELSLKINMLQKIIPYIGGGIFAVLGLIMFVTRTKIRNANVKDQFEQIIDDANSEVEKEFKIESQKNV